MKGVHIPNLHSFCQTPFFKKTIYTFSRKPGWAPFLTKNIKIAIWKKRGNKGAGCLTVLGVQKSKKHKKKQGSAAQVGAAAGWKAAGFSRLSGSENLVRALLEDPGGSALPKTARK